MEDAAGGLLLGRQGEARGQRFRRNKASLEEDFIVRRQHNQPQIHVAGDAGVAEIKRVVGGGVQREVEDFAVLGELLGTLNQMNVRT